MIRSLQYISQSLIRLYTPNEANRLAILVMQHVTGFSQAHILTSKNTILSEIQNKKIQMIVERLKKSEPLEYILGETEFYGLTFEVNPSTLIPRPETEELVDWIIHDNKNTSPYILDIGTGSGCIAISLAKYINNANVTAWDISAEALKTAHKNAVKNNVAVTFKEKNILETDNNPEQKFNIIASNPPYVLNSEKKEMHHNVLNHEPHQALFVPDNDPLLFYKAIATYAQLHLHPGGSLYFEINRAFGNDTRNMLTAQGFTNVELRKDLCRNDRMIKAVV